MLRKGLNICCQHRQDWNTKLCSSVLALTLSYSNCLQKSTETKEGKHSSIPPAQLPILRSTLGWSLCIARECSLLHQPFLSGLPIAVPGPLAPEENIWKGEFVKSQCCYICMWESWEGQVWNRDHGEEQKRERGMAAENLCLERWKSQALGHPW